MKRLELLEKELLQKSENLISRAATENTLQEENNSKRKIYEVEKKKFETELDDLYNEEKKLRDRLVTYGGGGSRHEWFANEDDMHSCHVLLQSFLNAKRAQNHVQDCAVMRFKILYD